MCLLSQNWPCIYDTKWNQTCSYFELNFSFLDNFAFIGFLLIKHWNSSFWLCRSLWKSLQKSVQCFFCLPDAWLGKFLLNSPWESSDSFIKLSKKIVNRYRRNSSVSKEPAWSAGDLGLIPGSGRSPWRRKWQPTPVFLSRESYGQRSLAGYTFLGVTRVGHNLATKPP